MTIKTAERSVQDNSLGLRLTVIRRPSERMLASAYLRLWQDEVLESLWYSGYIPNVSEFLEMSNRDDTVSYVGLVGPADGERLDVCGIGWAKQRRPVGLTENGTAYIAEVGMGFAKSVQGMDSRITRELAEMMLDDGFTHLDFIALYGTTPVKNLAAVRFIDRMGFERVGRAPCFANWHGSPCDAILSVMTKERWYSKPRAGEEGPDGGTR